MILVSSVDMVWFGLSSVMMSNGLLSYVNCRLRIVSFLSVSIV